MSVETVPIWINGEEYSDSNHITFPVIQGTTKKQVYKAQSATTETAIATASAAKTAFQTWKKTPHTVRRELLLRVADHYEQNAEELIKYQMEETSCTEAWGRTNIDLAVRYVRETAACISTISGVIPQIEKPNTMGFVFKDPIGPVLCIAPWNAALVLSTRGIASAIGAGCTVVFKASELSPRTHFAITQAFTQCGAPPGVLNQIQTRREDAAEVTEALIAHEAIRKIEFIGSAAVGKVVGQLAAKYLKPILMELGGKCPAIVLDDANLEEAAHLCAVGAVIHSGQICFSTERIIVLKAVAEKFQELLVKEVEAMEKIASASVSESIFQHAVDVWNDSKAKSDKFLVGGDMATLKPLTLKPALILEPKNSRIVDEETFGPSASFYVVETDAEAIELANKSSFGLNATIHTTNMERAIRMARELEYGQVHCNSISAYTSPTASQGGVKGSGYGRQNGRWGLEEFVVDKFVSWHGKE